MSDKKKFQSDDYREEMEELARIFKEELDKAVQDSEDSTVVEDIEELEVDGYNPREVSTEGVEREYAPEELCECCGERPRGTDKNPNSPFCSECEAILEKYPYDWKGLTAFVLTIFVSIAAIICFIVNMPVFSYTIEGEKAYDNRDLYTAMIKYEKAESLITEENAGKYLNIHKNHILNKYALLDMDGVLVDTSSYFSDFALKLPMYKELGKIKEEIVCMQATVMVIQDAIGEYEDISNNNYDEIIAILDGFVGKKLYVKGSSYHLETEEGFTPDGTEDVYICDESWINMYKYSAAQYVGKDEKTIAEYLAKASENSEYLSNLVNPLLASTYVGIGEYDKAETLIEEIKANNQESADYYMVKSMLYRYRDKDYQKGVDITIKGLNALSKIPDGSDLIADYGYILSMQKTLNYIMLKDYVNAYHSAEECYAYQSESYAISVQVRDLYAMLALETGDTDTYTTLKEEIEEYGEEESGFSKDVEDYRNGKVTLQDLAMSGGYDLV